MIIEGVSLDDIENLTVEDCNNLWNSLQSGLWGPHKDYNLSYTSIVPHISSGKGRTPTIDKIYPDFWDWVVLGEKTKQEELGTRAAKALLAMGGAPKHIQEKLLGTKNGT